MPSKIVKTLHWYFINLNGSPSNFTPEEDNTYSKHLGELIGELPNEFDGLRFACTLANGEAGLTREKEYEYVGRGFVDPFYRRTHNNDNCFDYVYDYLKERETSDYSRLEGIRKLKISRDGFAALLPLVALIMAQHSEVLKQEASIDFRLENNTLKQLTKDRFIADLSTSERIGLMQKSDFHEVFTQLRRVKEVDVPLASNGDTKLNFFKKEDASNPKMKWKFDTRRLNTSNLAPAITMLAMGIAVFSLALILNPPLAIMIAAAGVVASGLGLVCLISDEGVGLKNAISRVPV